MSFTYSIQAKKNYRLVRLEGSLLSLMDGNKLLEELQITDTASARIVLDLGKVKFLNSEGFNVLLKILTACRHQGGDAVVLHLSDELRQLFIITKLNSVFTVAENPKAAAAGFGG